MHNGMAPPNFKHGHCFQAIKRFLIYYSLLENSDPIQEKQWS